MSASRERRVLILGAEFPPSILPPALRVRLFANHLPHYGWRPTVLTVEPEFYEHRIDESGLALVAGGVEVVRTRALPSRWTRRVGFGDLGLRTLWHHRRVVAALARRREIDAVLIPVPHFYPMVLGRTAHRHGVPYVIDYSDPWVDDSWRRLPKAERLPKRRWSDLLSRKLEPYAVAHAAHLVGVSQATVDTVVARYPHLAGIGTSEIPMGGEPADFELLARQPRENRVFDPGDGRLHLSYVGVVASSMKATLGALFAAVARGRRENPGVFGRLVMHFVGTTYDPKADLHQVLPIAAAHGVDEGVEERPARLSHLDALQVLLDSDALALVGTDARHYTPSKVFPNVLAARPLLALLHRESTAVEILRRTASAETVTYDAEHPPATRVDEILAALTRVLGAASRGARPRPDAEAFAPYTARALTGRLAAALDDAVERTP